jgi:hypothetical protein
LHPMGVNHAGPITVTTYRSAGVQAVARGPGLNSGPYKVGLHRLTRVVRSDLVEFEPTGAY